MKTERNSGESIRPLVGQDIEKLALWAYPSGDNMTPVEFPSEYDGSYAWRMLDQYDHILLLHPTPPWLL